METGAGAKIACWKVCLLPLRKRLPGAGFVESSGNQSQRVCRARGCCNVFSFYSESDSLKHFKQKSDMTWLLFKMITVVTIVKLIVGVTARAESGLGGFCKNIG